MKKEDYKGKKVAVLGAGVEGLSSAKWLVGQGAAVTILDQKEKLDPQTLKVIRKIGDVRVIGGTDYLRTLSEYEIVVRSPGVKLSVVEEAIKNLTKKPLLTSQTQLFLDLSPAKIIGVTGTKGKGTTASLIYEMLKKNDFDTYLGGNIGTPPFDFFDKLTNDSWVVLELSSFQLEDTTKSSHIAVVLMVTSEHLGKDTLGTQNYHEDISEYIIAKRNILTHQVAGDFAVVNRDYPASNESDIYTDGKVFYVSRERGVTEEGCYIEENAVWVKKSGKTQKIIDTEKILLPGKHNLENVCAATMAAIIAGVSKESIASVLQSFKGLEHRLELVGEVKGVKYYDDSFSTTPETAIAAIEAFKNPEILILGGSKKGSDFSELAKTIAKTENIRAIIGIGVEWERIRDEIETAYASSEQGEARSSRPSGTRTIRPLIVERAADMKTIVLAAHRIAKSGDVVLLSPACASFDMFSNYKERGEQFKKEVLRLP